MTYRGKVKNGVIVLDPPAQLADGTEVSVVPTEIPSERTLAERYHDFIGVLEGLPPDMAENHDRYIHGTGKDERDT